MFLTGLELIEWMGVIQRFFKWIVFGLVVLTGRIFLRGAIRWKNGNRIAT
jgi:hypothetical protein